MITEQHILQYPWALELVKRSWEEGSDPYPISKRCIGLYGDVCRKSYADVLYGIPAWKGYKYDNLLKYTPSEMQAYIDNCLEEEYISGIDKKGITWDKVNRFWLRTYEFEDVSFKLEGEKVYLGTITIDANNLGLAKNLLVSEIQRFNGALFFYLTDTDGSGEGQVKFDYEKIEWNTREDVEKLLEEPNNNKKLCVKSQVNEMISDISFIFKSVNHNNTGPSSREYWKNKGLENLYDYIMVYHVGCSNYMYWTDYWKRFGNYLFPHALLRSCEKVLDSSIYS